MYFVFLFCYRWFRKYDVHSCAAYRLLPIPYQLCTNLAEIRDMCRPKARPDNGNVKCTRSRHRTQLFYKTKCSFTCNQGFRMLGPASVHCNGTGYWNSAESTMCICRLLTLFLRASYISVVEPFVELSLLIHYLMCPLS